MDEMPSAQFRKVYAKLTQPTLVTVNGHPIGEWTPRRWRVETTYTTTKAEDDRARFNSRPFTPVPKR